jgi:hypothetical protein
MKSWHLGLLALGLGLLVGFGSSLWRFGWPKSGSQLDPRIMLGETTGTLRSSAKVAVALKTADGKLERGKTRVDFGVTTTDRKDRAEFVFSNEGDAPLTLRHGEGDSSCRCAIGQVANGEVPPGEGTIVTLEWDTTEQQGQFRHHAIVHTNDPRTPRVRLEVNGTVARGVSVFPQDLLLGRIPRREPKSVSFQVEAFRSDDFKIESCQLADDAFAAFVDFKIEKLQKDKLQNQAKAGYRVEVTLKPGLPLGEFQHKIRLTTNQSAPKELPLVGTVIGDITVGSGAGWVSELQFLHLGQVDSSVESQHRLHLMVRGEHREKLQLQVKSTTPPNLKAAFEKPESLKTIVRWPLVITIPRGTPAMDHLASSNHGKIVIQSDHPEEKELIIPVSFAVK